MEDEDKMRRKKSVVEKRRGNMMRRRYKKCIQTRGKNKENKNKWGRKDET